MDSFEIARRKARAWHRAAAADANDVAGWELVRRIARERSYELIPRQADDVLLSGAEAVLDRGIEAIFYHGAISEAAAAALVAHELGHLALHQGQTVCDAEDVDVSATDETVPSAVQRVESYGVRERQELQANVFARELLLPREHARRHFLDEGRAASSIAEHRALPLDVVRQQLCDALLIPPYPARGQELEDGGAGDDAEGEGGLRLDPSQRAAAHHRGSPLLLEAGPGTGKTRALVGRVVHLIEEGADPGSILALTFSNKAAREITERVAEALPEQAPRVWTGTFHAFGLELLRQHHQMVELEPEVRVLDRSDAIELLEELLPTLGLVHHQNLYEPAFELREMLAAISRAKDELVDAEAYTALAEAMLTDAVDDGEPPADAKDAERARVAAEKALEVARVYRVYQRTLRALKAVDFGDLIMIPTRLLERETAVRDAVRLRYRHVLVDEYQDVNRASARLLREIAGDGSRLWVVGDARQSIYRFRGASSANLARFEQDFPGAERKALQVCYRSSAEIVSTFTRFARTMEVSERSLELRLIAARGPSGEEPDLRVAADPDAEVAAVAARIEELRRAGLGLSEQAVLCRSNATLNHFAEGLEARGLSVLHLGSLFERDEVRDLLSLLALVVDPWGGGLVRVAAFPAYRLSLPDLRLFLAAVREQELSALEAIRDPERVDGLSDDARERLARIARDLKGVERTSTPWNVLATYLFEGSGYLAELVQSDTIADRMRAVALYQFLSFVRGTRLTGRGFRARLLLDRVRRLVLLGEERDLRQIPAAARHLGAVRLLTVHGAKGLEFEAVHVPSLMSRGLPCTFQPPRCPPPAGLLTTTVDDVDAADPVRADHNEEEECLFFVALSRARSHLHLYRPLQVGKTRRKPSIFVERLEPELVTIEEPPELPRLLPRTAGEDVALVTDGALRVSGSELAEYERCPRRFLYGRLLGLAGTRRDSAFYKTQRAVYRVLDELRTLPAGSELDAASVAAKLEDVWGEVGPVDHAFEREYRELADQILGNLVAAHAGLELAEVEPFVVELGRGRVELEPALALPRPGGGMLLRVLKTGRKGSYKGDDVDLGLLQQAAGERYGEDGFSLEVVHLLDRGLTPIAMSERMRQTRRGKSRRYLDAIAGGRFPARPDAFKCPRCPYFFVCPALPQGELDLRAKPEAATE